MPLKLLSIAATQGPAFCAYRLKLGAEAPLPVLSRVFGVVLVVESSK